MRPNQRIKQVNNFIWLILGIYKSRSVYLSRIAGKMRSKVKLPSLPRRLNRLLANPAIRFENGTNRLLESGWTGSLAVWEKSV